MDLFNENILNASYKERIEFFLLTYFFVTIGSWLYQNYFCKKIEPNLVIIVGMLSVIPYFFIISIFLWNTISCILIGLLFGFLTTRKVS